MNDARAMTARLMPPAGRMVLPDGRDLERMITMNLTPEQAGMIYEAMELAQTLAHRAGDFEAFCRFSHLDAIENVVEGDYSEEYKRLDSTLREAMPTQTEVEATI